MANICDTTYKVTGSTEALESLWNTLQELKVNEKNVWLGDLAKHYGIDPEEKRCSVRGEIYWAEYDEEVGLLSFDTESAWCEIGTYRFKSKSEPNKNQNFFIMPL